MRKAAFITLSILATITFVSCASNKSSCNGYHGVNNLKAVKKQQKEFKKPKHKLERVRVEKNFRH